MVATACGGATDTTAPASSAPALAEQEPATDDDAGATPDDAATTGATNEAASDVPPALEFTAETVAGGQFDGADLAGGDVLLWFWAPW